MVARVSLNTIVQNFNLVQNGQALQSPALGAAAGRDGVLSQQEAQSLQNVLAVSKDTGKSTSLYNLMSQNNIGGIALDLSNDILGTPDLSAPAVPIAEINKGFVTQQNGKRVKASVLQQAAGTDGILTVAEADTLKNVIVTNKKTKETLNLADCMTANGVAAIDLNNPGDPAGAKGVPIAELAKTFSAQQNGQPVSADVLRKAAGKDGLLTVQEAAKLDDVILTNNETGESLNLADCMVKNGVASIDLNEPATGVPLADLTSKFTFVQNGTDVSINDLLTAAGDDKILSQSEAEALQNVIVINNATGKTLNLADCMKANNVKAIDLRSTTLGAPAQDTPTTVDDFSKNFTIQVNVGDALNEDPLSKAAGDDGILTQQEAESLQNVVAINNQTGSASTLADAMKANGTTSLDLRDSNVANPGDITSADSDSNANTPTSSSGFRQQLIQVLQQMLEMMMQLFFQA